VSRQKLGTLLYMAQLRYGSNYEEKVLTVMVNNSTNKLFISPDVMVYKMSGLLTADGTVAETCPTEVPLATSSSMVNLYVGLSNTGG
jgi:hypothetical protein